MEQCHHQNIGPNGQGFTIHAFCKYTDELEFIYGEHAYLWMVGIETDKNPGMCYHGGFFFLEERDEESESMEICRIADVHVDQIPQLLAADTEIGAMEGYEYTPEQAKAILRISETIDDIKAFEDGRSESMAWLEILVDNMDPLRGSCGYGTYAAEEAKFLEPSEMAPDMARAWYVYTLNLIKSLSKYGADEVRGALGQGKFVGVMECMAEMAR